MNQDLPVWQLKDQICSTVAQNTFTVLQGETGSGKTTQVPWYLAQHFQVKSLKKQVACTQPRRVAATSVARRVSQEIGQKLGEAVGYSIRFEDVSSANTQLKFLTDGMLLREATTDPLLSKYAVVVIDEAHERTLATDILMGMLKELVSSGKRPDLHILVMSATLDAPRFQAYLDNCPLVCVPGRTFPVEIVYCSQPQSDYLDAAVKTCISICSNEPPGDILLFLTGEEEIEEACRALERQTNALVLPLYSSLSSAAQQRVFEPAGGGEGSKKKIVIATNIAETSLTIDGIIYVVDSGYVKQKIYNPRVRVESLQVIPISRASAAQRAGRAGRTAPGKCFRLYTEQSFWRELAAESHPEILRCNLAVVVLQLLRIGIQDLVHFDFMDPPAPETLMRAYELLNYLGAIDDDGNLTEEGKRMSDFPLDPQLAKVLIWASRRGGCPQEVLSIVALLSVQPPWMRPNGGAAAKREAEAAKAPFSHPDGDHLALLKLFQAWQQEPEKNRENWCYENWINSRAMKAASSVRDQLQRHLEKAGLSTRSTIVPGTKAYWESVKKALVSGFFMQIAHLERGSLYATVKDNQIVKVHPSASISGKPHWLLYNEFVLTSQHFIRCVTAVNPAWLLEMAPHYYDLETFPSCEAKRVLERMLASNRGGGGKKSEKSKKHRLEEED